jgi:hypothetical protein
MVNGKRFGPGNKRTDGGQETNPLIGWNEFWLLVNPTSSHPSVAQLCTVIVLKVVLVITASPLIGVPTRTRVLERVTRTLMGGLAIRCVVKTVGGSDKPSQTPSPAPSVRNPSKRYGRRRARRFTDRGYCRWRVGRLIHGPRGGLVLRIPAGRNAETGVREGAPVCAEREHRPPMASFQWRSLGRNQAGGSLCV